MQLTEELHFDQPNSNLAVSVELRLAGVFPPLTMAALFVCILNVRIATEESKTSCQVQGSQSSINI